MYTAHFHADVFIILRLHRPQTRRLCGAVLGSLTKTRRAERPVRARLRTRQD